MSELGVWTSILTWQPDLFPWTVSGTSWCSSNIGLFLVMGILEEHWGMQAYLSIPQCTPEPSPHLTYVVFAP